MTMNTSAPLTVSCVPFYAHLFVFLVSSLTRPDCVAESTTTDTSQASHFLLFIGKEQPSVTAP